MNNNQSESYIGITVNHLIEELRESDNGIITSIKQLLIDTGESLSEFSDEDLLSIHNELLKMAKDNNIYLEIKDDTKEINPIDHEFSVNNTDARIKCPHCGSKNTARIIYGLPDIDEKIQKKRDEGKIVFSGCLIGSVLLEEGHAGIMPQRQCNQCDQRFGSEPALVKKDQKGYKLYTRFMTSLNVTTDNNLSGVTEINIQKNEQGALINGTKQITSSQWDELLRILFEKLFLHEWKKEYIGLCLSDGPEWSIDLGFSDGTERHFHGSRATPPYWSEFIRLLEEFR